jgi:phage tail protein X
MHTNRKRAPTRPRVKRGLRALLVSIVAVPSTLVVMTGVAAAEQPADPGGGGILVTSANVAECPGGGLKLDGINDKLIPDGTYSDGGLTIVIDDSAFDADTGVLSFDWTATQVPTGKVVSGVVVKGGSEASTESGGTGGHVEWDTPPWYSHVSFCLGGLVTQPPQPSVCPGTTTPITDVTDANADGIADMCQSFCPGTQTVVTATTDGNADGIADMCQSFCPGTQTLVTATTDGNADGIADMCQSFCPGTQTVVTATTDGNADGIADMCQSFCPGTQTVVTATTDGNADGIADMCQSFCPGTQTVVTATTDGNADGIADMCQSFCPGTQTLITATTDADNDGIADMCQVTTPGGGDTTPQQVTTVTVVTEPVVPEPEPELEIIEVEEEATVEVLVEETVAPAVVETIAAPATVEAPAATLAARVAPAPAPADQLPRTGVASGTLAQLALALIGLGLVLTRLGGSTAKR